MSKAILILNEMPSKCGNCPLLQQWYDDEYKKRFDMCFWRYCKIEDTESKLNVCPLKEMPKKLEFKTDRLTLKSNMGEIDNYIKNLGYERVGNIHDTIGGYNACIDEILGGNDE